MKGFAPRWSLSIITDNKLVKKTPHYFLLIFLPANKSFLILTLYGADGFGYLDTKTPPCLKSNYIICTQEIQRWSQVQWQAWAA